jgi:hypothetical protein
VLNVFFVRALSARIPKSDPTILINNVCPGFAYSELRREAANDPQKAAMFQALEKEFAYTAEEGSRHIVYGALVGLGNREEEENIKGKYLASSKMVPVSELVISKFGKETEDKVWVRRFVLLFCRSA